MHACRPHVEGVSDSDTYRRLGFYILGSGGGLKLYYCLSPLGVNFENLQYLPLFLDFLAMISVSLETARSGISVYQII